MITLGVTGGIGMGKSAATSLLQQRGVKTIDTDQLARDVVEPGTPGLAETVALLGPEVLDSAGRLNRKEVARRVFADPQLREKLESILHPRIRERWQSQLAQWQGQGLAKAAVIIPLLFETNAQASFDAVICITCSAKTQHARLQARGWSPEQIQQRIAAQFPVQKKMDLADFVVWNEGSLEILGTQLDHILARLK